MRFAYCTLRLSAAVHPEAQIRALAIRMRLIGAHPSTAAGARPE